MEVLLIWANRGLGYEIRKELTNNKLWNIKEFFKSNYITNKDVEAWLCLAEIIK